MKYLATLLLIMSFAGIGIFGFSLFDHTMMNSSNSNCVASTIGGTECPTSIMSMTLHHISAIQTLTTALPSSSSLFLLLVSLLFIGLAFFFPHRFNPPQLALYRYRSRDFFSPPQERKYLRWLALHENSPATP